MRDAVDRLPAAASGSPTPTQPEATDRSVHNKESQSRESSFLGGIVDASPPLAPTAASPAPALSPQASLSLLSPSSHNHATPVTGSHAASPSKSRLSSVRFPDGGESQTASFKRSPIKVGYLFKQSSGSWKRKRWNQRWFVLDTEMGILKYFRHESLPEAVPFRQDAHGVIHLKEPGASLVIQGDLPRNVPTPFCFTVFDGNRSFLICADSNQEFREWTSAISAILSPRKLTADGLSPGSPNATTSRRASTDSALDRAVSLPVVSAQVVTQTDTKLENERASSLSSSLTKRDADALVTSIHKGSDARPSLQQTVVALAVFNSVAVIVRYGSVECLYASLLGVNAFFVWALWFQKPAVRPVSSQCIRHDDDTSANSATDDSSSGVAGQLPPSSPRGRDSKSSQPDSPRKATLPRLEKLPSASFQPTKFLGTINGVKAKAGDSVKMCPPAPAAIITGCWTQISGTRFQVRQGPNYRKTKHKAPSEESLLELLAIDIYRSPSKIDNVASIVDLGDLKPENSPLDLFIVNCQVPSYQPSNPLWGEKQGNGVGFNFVSYFAISPEIRQQLKEHEPGDQAVRLLKNFMQDNSSVRDRFKAIGIVVNPQEQQQLGRTERHLLETYNGQPILTRPQHRFYRGDGYFEVDVDAHEFNYVARKGLAGVSDHFRNMVVDFGFVLEGQDDLELPEQMLGCVRLCKIDVRQALEIT